MLVCRPVVGAPATRKMTSLQAATLVPSGGVMAGLSGSGGPGVELPFLPNVLVSFRKYLATARPFVVGSLLAKGPSSGK